MPQAAVTAWHEAESREAVHFRQRLGALDLRTTCAQFSAEQLEAIVQFLAARR